MKKILIIGGGLAGLSAAVNLLENGFQVDIYESTKELGGRTKSFDYKNQLIDNGQHLMMGCYDYSIEFLKKIDALANFDFQNRLQVNFVDSSGNKYNLKAVSKFYPFNLLFAILGYDYLKLNDKMRLIKFFVKLIFTNPNKIENISISEWLQSNGQNENIIKGLWHLLAISALNSDLNEVPASLFAKILKQMFLRGNKSATIVIPSKSLTESFVKPAEKFILASDGKIIKGERVVEIEADENNNLLVKTNKKTLKSYDYVITAVTPNVLKKLVKSADNELLNEIRYSPIISLHIWLKQNPFKENFYGLIGSEVHWLFNHNNYISLVISSAEKLLGYSKDELLALCNSELSKYFPEYSSDFVTDVKIVKEQKATIVPDFEVEKIRKKIRFNIDKLYFCGDWINTGLPGTIESAIKSGKLTAKKIINTTAKRNL